MRYSLVESPENRGVACGNPSSIASRLAIVSIVLVGLAPRPALGQSSSQYLDRLNNQALPRWNEYARFAKGISGSLRAVAQTKGPSAGKYHTEGEVHIKQTSHSALLQDDWKVLEADDTRPVSTVFACNARYAFQADRRTRESEWLLKSYVLGSTDGSDVTQDNKPLRDLIFESVGPQFMVMNISLPSLIQDAKFSIAAMTDESRNGTPFVRLEFDFDNPIDAKSFATPLQGGSLLLDPRNDWHIHEADLRLKGSNGESAMLHCQFSFKAVSGPHLLPTHSTRSRKVSGKETFELSVEYDLRETNDSIQDSEFTLSAYGLPEPVGVTWAKPTPRFIWFLIAGGASAIIALAFFYSKNRLARVKC